jgi:hypothetical protein
MEAGKKSLSQYQSGVSSLSDFEFQFDPTIADPSYDFRFEQGMRAADRGFAAAGQRISGGRVLGMQEYGQKFASQEYQKEYQRQMQTAKLNYGFKSDNLNRLYNLSTMGATAAQNLGQIGAGTGARIGEYDSAGELGMFRGIGDALEGVARVGGQQGWFGGENRKVPFEPYGE